MNEIILSIGSNAEGRRKVAEAISRLSSFVYSAHATPVIDTDPIAVSSAQPFANAMMRGYTSVGVIHLDIDIMQYGGQRLKLSDWQRPYIITLLKTLFL